MVGHVDNVSAACVAFAIGSAAAVWRGAMVVKRTGTVWRLRLPRIPATLWVTIQNSFEQFFWLLLFALQAPLLGPHPFGQMALAMVFVGFCEFLVATVASEALLAVVQIDALHYRCMLAVNATVAVIFAAILFVGAGWIGQWFGDPTLANVMRCLALVPCITCFAPPANAYTRRRMDFRPVSIRSIFGLCCGGAIGLLLTLAGAGVWALVAQALIQRLAGVIALWRVVPLPFRSSFSKPHAKELARLAWRLTLARVMGWGSGQMPRLILGWYLGVADLGLFSLATRISDILGQIAVIPATAVARIDLRRFIHDRSGLDASAERLFRQVAAIGFPLAAMAAAATPTLFHVWLDQRWLGAILSTQYLLLGIIPSVTFYCATAILLALNMQGAEAVIAATRTIVLGLAVMAAAPFGLTRAVGAIAALPFLLLPLPLIILQRQCGIPVRMVLRWQAPALGVSAMLGLLLWHAASRLQEPLGDIGCLAVLSGLGVAGYGLGLAATLPRRVEPAALPLIA